MLFVVCISSSWGQLAAGFVDGSIKLFDIRPQNVSTFQRIFFWHAHVFLISKTNITNLWWFYLSCSWISNVWETWYNLLAFQDKFTSILKSVFRKINFFSVPTLVGKDCRLVSIWWFTRYRCMYYGVLFKSFFIDILHVLFLSLTMFVYIHVFHPFSDNDPCDF